MCWKKLNTNLCLREFAEQFGAWQGWLFRGHAKFLGFPSTLPDLFSCLVEEMNRKFENQNWKNAVNRANNWQISNKYFTYSNTCMCLIGVKLANSFHCIHGRQMCLYLQDSNQSFENAWRLIFHSLSPTPFIWQTCYPFMCFGIFAKFYCGDFFSGFIQTPRAAPSWQIGWTILNKYLTKKREKKIWEKHTCAESCEIDFIFTAFFIFIIT